MVNRRLAFALAFLVAISFSGGLVAQQQQPPKQTDAQKKDIQSAVKIADEVAAGQPAPNDLGLAWVREDFLKAQGNKQYVPFTVTIDPSKVAGGSVALYWRVVAKSAAAPAAAAPGQPGVKEEKKDDKKRPEYAYEDVGFIPVTAGATPMRVSRSFTVPGGNYDVYIVAKEPTPEKAPRNAPPPKASVLKQTVNVPDYWNAELATSSILITQRIDPLPAPLTPQQQVERPYALGTMELVPSWDLKFSKKSELSTFFLIYNPKTDGGNKPDITVEYNFYTKAGGSEKFFNKTNPQNLNAQTLPPQFDLAAGHQLQSGEAVPLALFPEGDYRLEIKITDKIANKSLTRDVNFTVTAS